MIVGTAHHLYWNATSHAWTEAVRLHVGDRLQTREGHTVPVVGLHPHSARMVTYSLSVATVHTYYVLAGNTAVLVHNGSRGKGCEFSDSVKRQGVDRNLVENDGELRCEYSPSTSSPHPPKLENVLRRCVTAGALTCARADACRAPQGPQGCGDGLAGQPRRGNRSPRPAAGPSLPVLWRTAPLFTANDPADAHVRGRWALSSV